VNANLRLIVVVAIGAVIGSVLNQLLAAAGAPDWMVRVLPMGLEPPLSLNLVVMRLYLGFILNISFATVIGMAIAMWIFHKLR
jgi:hypothetical protein